MADRQADTVLLGLCKLVEAQAAQLTDGELLSRFADHRDEAAFAVLLQRDGRLVYGVCRNVLRHEQDAEDAFQATFLVLARRAGAIRTEQAIGSWLYRVAYRVAMKARQAADRRRRQEKQAFKSAEQRPTGDFAWRELQAMLDVELNRLPSKYRTPFVLCCLMGKSKSEAAAELAWKEGTVSSRLAHARQLLRTRLARRGVMLSALLSGLAISDPSGAASVPTTLLASTQELALGYASQDGVVAGKSLAAVELAKTVIHGYSVARLKVAAIVLLVIGLASASVAIVLHKTSNPENPPEAPIVDAASPPINAPVLAGKVELVPVRQMSVSGSVVGPDGNPVPGAKVVVVASDAHGPRELSGTDRTRPLQLGAGPTEAQGEYRLSVPQTTAWNRGLSVLAYAPGYALTYQKSDHGDITASTHQLAPIKLVKGQKVRGRLLDFEGKPAKRAQVHVLVMSRNGASWLSAYYYNPPNPAPPGWPENIVTDDQGNFVLNDIGPDTQVYFQVRDERYAIEWHQFTTPKTEEDKAITFTMSPPHIVEGRITCEDTGKPLANAPIVIESTLPDFRFGLQASVAGRTDEDGRYRLSVFPGMRVQVEAYPPNGVPYLTRDVSKNWPKGAVHSNVDFTVMPGIVVRGKVKEAGTERPLADVHVWHEYRHKNNPFLSTVFARTGSYSPGRGTRTGADGGFSITVPPGPGAVLIKSMDPEYVQVEMPGEEYDGGPPGGSPYFPHAFAPLNVKPADKPGEFTFYLRRGITLRGKVTGKDGKPANSAWLISPAYVPEGTPLMDFRAHTISVRNGRFEMPGCDPGSKIMLCAFDANKGEGVIAEHTMGSPNEPELRMLPFTYVRVKIAGPASGIKTSPAFSTELVLRPSDFDVASPKKNPRPAISIITAAIRGLNNRTIVKIDGEYVISNLIAGANYTITARVPQFEPATASFTTPLKEPAHPMVVTLEPRPLPRRK